MTNTDLSFYVSEVNWPNELEPARDFARQAVSEWKWKDKSEKILREIEKAGTIKRLQQLVIYPILSGEGIGVIK